MSGDTSFARVRDAVARDMVPVSPIRPAPLCALIALPLGIFIASVVLLVYGLRADADGLGFWPLWGPAMAMVAAAYGVLTLALAQRVPGSTASWIWWIALPAIAVAVQIGGAQYTLHHAAPVAATGWPLQSMCFWRISMIGVPPVLLVLWLLSRGLPFRPKLGGLMGGLAGGAISEGIYRLHCGMSHASHVVPWHTGAVLVMGLLGLLLGLWWERRQLVSWAERTAS